jgi:3-oxoacyl-[acyl-carrier-protein] synthase-3|tara:strand:+ start:4239 stop:5231 length:993 start_codon:yes stop_codon:yes gene_type:complete
MRNSRIAGIGYYVPDNIVNNADLEKLMDTTNEWIIERTGISERRHVTNGMGTSHMGIKASEKALEMAGVIPEDIDLVIFATITSDYYFPGSSVQVQEQMGMGTIGAFDIRVACSAFIYGLSIGDQFIKTGQYDNVLVIGGEVQSTALQYDTEHRDISVIFGDGAGAAVLQPSRNSSAILSTHLHSEGKHLKNLWCEGPSSIENPRMSHEMIDEGRHLPIMNGREVFRHAITRFPEVIDEALDHNNLSIDDVKLIIPHQANHRISEAVAKRMGVSMDKVFSNIHKYGNTTAASIPIAMSEALAERKFSEGDIIVLAAFGAGFTWASAAIRW